MRKELKVTFKNPFTENYVKKGTKNIMQNENDKANQERAEQVELKNMIKKYGITPFEYLNSTKEPLYLDMRGSDMSINERLQEKHRIDDYFNKMPAEIREKYHSNKELFYEELINGNHNEMIKQGVLTEEHSQQIKDKRTEKDTIIKNLQATMSKLQEQVANIGVKENDI